MNNKKVIDDAFKAFEKDIEHEILRELSLFSENLVYKAIQERMKAPGKHDFTGNLLNSIVSAVYKDKKIIEAYFAGETGLKKPYYYKMTASHGTYVFGFRDYEGRKGTTYTPVIETVRQKGLDDAMEFLSLYTPPTNEYTVVLAYTTEYADWVEQQRATTGYLATFKYAKRVAMKKFSLKN